MRKVLILRILIILFLGVNSMVSICIGSVSRQQDSVLAVKLQKEGIAAGNSGDFSLALEKFTKVYQLRERMFGNTSIKLAPPLNNIGITYKNFGNLDKAIEVYKKVETICINAYEENSIILGIAYSNLGNIYSLKGDYSQALEYQKNAYRVLRRDSIKYLANLQICKYNIIETQLKLGQNIEAIKFARKNLNEVSPELKSRIYDLIALAYSNGGQYQLSETNYLLAIDSWIKLYGEGNIELISEYLAYSSMLLSQKQFDKARSYIEKADGIVLRFYNRKSTMYSDVLAGYGDYYYYKSSEAEQLDDFRKKRKESLQNALKYYQNSIVALVDSFENSDPFINPQLKNVISEVQLVEVIKKKASALKVLAQIFETEFDKQNAEKYYECSLNTYSIALDLIHRLQIGFENEDSRLFISQNQQKTFFEGISIAYKLYNLSKDRKYILKAFEFSEKSKSSSLLASIKDVKAKEFGGLPDSLLKQENELKSYISVYKSKLFEESHQKEPDAQKVNLYSSKVFKYNEEYVKLIDFFEKNYPQYFSLKYEDKVINVDLIQSRLSERQVLIEYFLKEPDNIQSLGELYSFTITNDSINIRKENVDHEFISKIQTFHDFLINPNYLETKRQEYASYTLAAYGLYEKLLKPVVDKLRGKSLTIIPHDKLSYIPFDALISEVPDTTRMNFRDLKYLIKDYPINYGYSATLLYGSYQKKKRSKNLLIFSPEYNQEEARRDVETGKIYHLSRLPGAKEEIKAISKYVSSVAFTDKMAQEYVFKREANKYDILHLAMHTIINDSIPMLSKLVFSIPDPKSGEDGCLNAYEVYNMNINARLVVLSACETGSGKLLSGEGVLSMARGFIYAGCPSVVMTLWQVEDKSGINIMGDFYRYLSKGKRKDVALRMAKLNHLDNSDPLTAHPHFWLGYVNIGSSDPLYTSKDVYFIIFIFIVIILLWLDYRVRRRKMK